MRTFEIKENAKLLEYLFLTLADTKKTKVRQLLKHGAILVNGKSITQFDHPLKPGDKLGIKSARDPRPVEDPYYGVKIVAQEEAFVVIDKPPSLLSVATEKEDFKTALRATGAYLYDYEVEKLRQVGKRDNAVADRQVYVVHRLDQAASGLMVFARTETAKQKMQADWPETVKKYYAVVRGVPTKKTGTLKSYLHESPSLNVYSGGPENGGKHSITQYEVLRSSSNYSILEVRADTGRRHQIRVHLADIGHPIVGDVRYGGKQNDARRLALHASYLAFKHPVSGKEVSFRAALPPSFDRILNEDKALR